jgi:hypothetical protein
MTFNITRTWRVGFMCQLLAWHALHPRPPCAYCWHMALHKRSRNNHLHFQERARTYESVYYTLSSLLVLERTNIYLPVSHSFSVYFLLPFSPHEYMLRLLCLSVSYSFSLISWVHAKEVVKIRHVSSRCWQEAEAVVMYESLAYIQSYLSGFLGCADWADIIHTDTSRSKTVCYRSRSKVAVWIYSDQKG